MLAGILLCMLGLAFTFFGKKIYETLLVVVGFVVGAIAGASLQPFFSGVSLNPTILLAILVFGGGVVGVFIAILVERVVIFLAGFAAGFVVAGYVTGLLGLSSSYNLFIAVLIAAIVGALALFLRPIVIVVLTAFLGSVLTVIGYFAVTKGLTLNLSNIVAITFQAASTLLFLFLFIAGLIVQFATQFKKE